MPTLRLYGTVTSPYVRRVRIVAHELHLPYELVDTFVEHGQSAMRAKNPTWKVPTVELDGEVILDSRVITEHLLRHFGPGPLHAHDPDDLAGSNLRIVIDGALDSLINAFYLAKDGVTQASSAYIAKQHERAAAAMAWLEAQVEPRWAEQESRFGLAEIGLVTALGWMRFRNAYPVERHPALLQVVERFSDRQSVRSTAPVG